MTVQELQQRQKWPLHQKIDHALGTVEAFIARTGKVPYVSFSGGKDSTVKFYLRRFDEDYRFNREFREIAERMRELLRISEKLGRGNYNLQTEIE